MSSIEYRKRPSAHRPDTLAVKHGFEAIGGQPTLLPITDEQRRRHEAQKARLRQAPVGQTDYVEPTIDPPQIVDLTEQAYAPASHVNVDYANDPVRDSVKAVPVSVDTAPDPMAEDAAPVAQDEWVPDLIMRQIGEEDTQPVVVDGETPAVNITQTNLGERGLTEPTHAYQVTPPAGSADTPQ